MSAHCDGVIKVIEKKNTVFRNTVLSDSFIHSLIKMEF